MQSEVARAVQELIRSGNYNAPPQFSSAGETLRVDDIYPVLKHCFNASAQKSLDNRAHSMLYEYNTYVGPKGFERWYIVEDMLRKLEVIPTPIIPYGIPFGYVRCFDPVYFFGSTCTIDTLGTACQKVVYAINDVADRGFTKASLMPLGIIRFASINDSEQHYAVLSYISLTTEGLQYAEQNMPNILFKEGGIPLTVDKQ